MDAQDRQIIALMQLCETMAKEILTIKQDHARLQEQFMTLAGNLNALLKAMEGKR